MCLCYCAWEKIFKQRIIQHIKIKFDAHIMKMSKNIPFFIHMYAFLFLSLIFAQPLYIFVLLVVVENILYLLILSKTSSNIMFPCTFLIARKS
jgi:hypothetical protein